MDEGPIAGHKYTFNSSELRMINVEMQLVPPVGQRVLVLVMRDWTDVLDARSDSRLFCMVIDEPL